MATIALLVGVIGAGVQVADRIRVEGVVWADNMQEIHATTPGWVHKEFRPDGTVVKAGDWLIKTDNPELEMELAKKLAERDELSVERMLRADQQRLQAGGRGRKVARSRGEGNRETPARRRGTDDQGAAGWHVGLAGCGLLEGTYLKRGDKLGTVAKLDKLIIRSSRGRITARS